MVRCLEASRIPMEDGGAVESDRFEAEVTDVARRSPLDGSGCGPQGARPLRAEQPFLPGDRVKVGPGLLDGDRDRPDGLGPVDDDESSGRPQDVRQRHELRPGSNRGVEGGHG